MPLISPSKTGVLVILIVQVYAQFTISTLRHSHSSCTLDVQYGMVSYLLCTVIRKFLRRMFLCTVYCTVCCEGWFVGNGRMGDVQRDDSLSCANFFHFQHWMYILASRNSFPEPPPSGKASWALNMKQYNNQGFLPRTWWLTTFLRKINKTRGASTRQIS